MHALDLDGMLRRLWTPELLSMYQETGDRGECSAHGDRRQQRERLAPSVGQLPAGQKPWPTNWVNLVLPLTTFYRALLKLKDYTPWLKHAAKK